MSLVKPKTLREMARLDRWFSIVHATVAATILVGVLLHRWSAGWLGIAFVFAVVAWMSWPHWFPGDPRVPPDS